MSSSVSRYEILAQLSHKIATSSDLSTLLAEVVTHLSQTLLPGSACAIFLIDSTEATLTLAATSDKTNISFSWPINETTSVGQVAISGVPQIVNSTTEAALICPPYFSLDPQAETVIPMICHKQTVGVVQVQSINPHSFTGDAIALLQACASQIAVTVENSQLLEERDRRLAELATFNQIGMIIAEHRDLETILLRTIQRIKSLFQVEGVSLLLLENEELRFVAAAGAEADELKTFSLKKGQGIAWSVIETQQTIRVDNVKDDPRHFGGIDTAIEFSTHSLLAVPIQTSDRILGVLEAMNRIDGRPFSRDDEVTLEFIVSTVAIVIENARLFSQMQREMDRKAGLLEASRALSNLDLQNTLNTIVQKAGNLLEAEHTVVYLINYELKQIQATAAHSTGAMIDMPTPPFGVEEGTVGWVLRHRQSLIINNVQADPRFIQISPQSKFIGNLVAVPLVVKGEVIGIIEATHKTGGQVFSAEDEALLAAFASQAAVAIDNARLFKETGERLAEVSTLYTLADQITRVLDLERIIEFTVIILKHAVDCTGCLLLLKERQGDSELFTLKASAGWHEDEQPHFEQAYLEALAKNLTPTSYPAYIKDVTRHAAPTLPQASSSGFMRSLMAAPLVAKDEVLGVLALSDNRPDAFGQAEGRLLTIAAAQLAKAIENIKLYDHLEKRARELETAMKELAEANQLKSEFVQNVSHELRTPLTFIISYIELMLEGTLGEIPPLIRDKLEIVSQKTQTIVRLVEDIISLQKIEAGNLQRKLISPREIITRAMRGAVANADQAGITISSRIAPKLPKLYIDIDRIEQVFDNLVANALKFSPPGSTIHLAAEPAADSVKFSIRDEGIGIPAHKLNKIFDRFYQVDGSTTRRYSGAGLGLAIIKQIVEVHGGHITVESVVNQGTTFTFWLPTQAAASGGLRKQ